MLAGNSNRDLTDGLPEQTALFELTDRLYRASSLSEAYEIGLDSIVKLLRCQRASILQFDLSGVMHFVAWRGLSDTYRKAVDGHSPWTPGSRDPEPIFIANFDETNQPDELKRTIRSDGIRGLGFCAVDCQSPVRRKIHDVLSRTP